MKTQHAITIIVFSCLLFSCKKENNKDCLKSNGLVAEESRILEAFDSLYIGPRFDVTLVEDTVDFIILKAGRNLLELISTDIKNNKLSLLNKNKCNWVRSYDTPLEAELHYSRMHHIEILGSGNLTNVDTLKNDSLSLELYDASGNVELLVDNQLLRIAQHTGANDVRVKGRTSGLYVYCASLGMTDCVDLNAMYVFARNKSSADMRVFSNGLFDLSVEGDGNLFYKGSGELRSSFRSGRGAIGRIF